MPINLKPLNERVLVITGATSGIGLATARMAAAAGAKVVAAARGEGRADSSARMPHGSWRDQTCCSPNRRRSASSIFLARNASERLRRGDPAQVSPWEVLE